MGGIYFNKKADATPFYQFRFGEDEKGYKEEGKVKFSIHKEKFFYSTIFNPKRRHCTFFNIKCMALKSLILYVKLSISLKARNMGYFHLVRNINVII